VYRRLDRSARNSFDFDDSDLDLTPQTFFKKQQLDRRDSILPRASDSMFNTEMKFTEDDDLACLSKAHDQIEF
jgi:hypothetical protein